MTVRNISVMLTANASSLRSQLAMAGREIDTFANKAQQQNAKVGGSAKLIGAGFAAAGAAVAAGLAYSISQATQFEQRMRNVNSISKLSEAQFKALGKSVLDLSTKLPQSANELAEGLYDIASSGFQGAAGLKVLEASATAASAGMSDTATAAKAITAVLNAYGRSADEADDVSDALFQTVNLGVISFGELAGVIGDVVGLAATAGIDIAQVGAAIATMTLSGISGAEAGTSLNRTIQGLIDPSDQLKTVFKTLGYESGVQALKTKGLHAVMMDLQKATGGNINSMMALFPEIRALRGALALTANEGANYNKVSAEIEDRNRRAGATAAALKEQMKAVTAQWKLFLNGLNAGAVALGTRLLPVVLQAITALKNLGRDALPTIISGARMLAPYFKRLYDIGVDLVHIAGDLIEGLTPLATVIAKVAGAAFVGQLMAFATVLKTITGFLADHPGLVQAVAVAYGVYLAAQVGKAAVAFASLAMDKIAIGLYDAAGGATKLAGSFSGVTAGITVAAIALMDYFTTVANNTRAAKEMREELENLAKVNTVSGQENAYQKASEQLMRSQGKLAAAQERVMRTLNPIAYRSAAKEVNKYQKEVGAAEKAQDAIMRSNQRLETNLGTLRQQTGATDEEISKFATSAGIDLTVGLKASEGTRQKIIDHFKELKDSVGLTSQEMQDNMGLDIAAIEALQATIDKLKTDVADAFFKSSDLLSGFDPEKYAKGLENVAKAQENVRDATDALNALQHDATEDIDQTDELARAHKRVAKAQDEEKVAMKGVTGAGDQIRTFYKDQIRNGETFIASVNDAIARGLDPQLVIRLLKAGPEAATPILQGILSDHSGKLIQTVNESEQKLRELNTITVEMARLTQLAVSSKTDAMTRDLPLAMDLATAIFRSGGKTSIEALAEELNVGMEDIKRTAASFGITVPVAVTWDINRDILQMDVDRAARSVTAPPVTVPTATPPFRGNANGSITAFARGGTKEKHVAQIARAGDWRLWAEPETGGEAYIPLARSKRTRSTAILTETARRMGYGLRVLDSGDLIEQIVGQQQFEQALAGTAARILSEQNASTSGLGGNVGRNINVQAYFQGRDATGEIQRVGEAYAQLALQVDEATAQQLLAQDITAEGYVSAAAEIIRTVQESRRAQEQATDTAVAAAEEQAEAQSQAQEQATEAAAEAMRAQRSLEDIMHEFGATSTQQYMAILDQRLAGERAYTEEWAAIQRQRTAILEDAAQKEAELAEQRREVENNQYQAGILSTAGYLAALDQRLAGEKAYTDAWMEIQAERTNVADAQRFYEQNIATIEQADRSRQVTSSSVDNTRTMSIVFGSESVKVEVRADAGVDLDRLASVVGAQVTTAMAEATRTLDNELRRG